MQIDTSTAEVILWQPEQQAWKADGECAPASGGRERQCDCKTECRSVRSVMQRSTHNGQGGDDATKVIAKPHPLSSPPQRQSAELPSVSFSVNYRSRCSPLHAAAVRSNRQNGRRCRHNGVGEFGRAVTANQQDRFQSAPGCMYSFICTQLFSCV